MSRPQGHRKSQSTSALAVIAAGGQIPSGMSSSRGIGGSSSRMSQSTSTSASTSTSTSTATPRASRRHQSQHSQSRLGAVIEDDRHEHTEAGNQSPGIDSDLAKLQRAMDERKASDGATPLGERSRSRPANGLDEVKAALNDIRSLRSSERRRLSALRKIERKLVQACAQQSHSGISISDLLKLDIHSALVSLLTRHAQTLSHRASRTHTTLSASDEVAIILKPELASIVLTLQGLCLIDQRAKDESGQSWMLELIIDQLLVLRAQLAPEGERPIVYLMLDLLCCILVDSPANCRTFESLNGLEGVVRVLKGSGVAKEVRMKCIEFLYFYLLPEKTGKKEAQTQRTSSASSSSTTSSTSSQLYPPKTTPEDLTPLASPTTPSRRQKVQTPTQKPYEDLDITFVPQTPQKKPQPSLGFLTPSTRRVSGSSSVTATPRSSVPPSPRRVPPSPSHRRLSSIDHDMEGGNFGLGLGLPRSSTAANHSARSEAKRDVTAIKLPQTETETPRRKPSSSDPFNNTTNSTATATTSSSGSSTVVPPSPRGMSRSSTQMNLPPSSSELRRTPSIVRTDTSHTGSSTSVDDTPQPRPPKVRHSHTSGHLSALATDPTPGSREGRPSKPRQSTSASASSFHSRASISISSDTSPSRGPSPTTTTTSTSMPPPPVPKPTSRKGFPAGITKGLPSAVSSPNLNSPLGAARRIPSGRLADRPSSKLKEVRSVEEKKELLGQWLGNVDALVQGVEKVSFWGNVDKR